MKISIHCDKEGVLRYVKNMPEKPNPPDYEWTLYYQKLEMLQADLKQAKQDSVPFEDQKLVRHNIWNERTGGYVNPHDFKLDPDTFYSFEFNGEVRVTWQTFDGFGWSDLPGKSTEAPCSNGLRPTRLVARLIPSVTETKNMETIELRENLAHNYADKLPDHQYMPARQGFEAGFVKGLEYASQSSLPVTEQKKEEQEEDHEFQESIFDDLFSQYFKFIKEKGLSMDVAVKVLKHKFYINRNEAKIADKTGPTR